MNEMQMWLIIPEQHLEMEIWERGPALDADSLFCLFTETCHECQSQNSLKRICNPKLLMSSNLSNHWPQLKYWSLIKLLKTL